MIDTNALNRKIYELKEVQRTAWRQLADPALTTFERREVRNQIRASNSELKYHLQTMSECLRSRVNSPAESADFGRPNLRLFIMDDPPQQPFELGA
jgi:hypothetical protein